ncbi:hypothetical protein ACFU9B_18175 [Streptomyces sp. NPDC057592]|uniref:hypothetical protein n=1 Tax=unclassified Streptomyces TaxID=2593676 RepID=UPI00369412D3
MKRILLGAMPAAGLPASVQAAPAVGSPARDTGTAAATTGTALVTDEYAAGIAFTGAWAKGKTPDALLCRELQESTGPRPHTPDTYLG